MHRIDFDGLRREHPETAQVLIAILAGQVRRLSAGTCSRRSTSRPTSACCGGCRGRRRLPFDDGGRVPLDPGGRRRRWPAPRGRRSTACCARSRSAGRSSLRRGRTIVLDAEALERRARYGRGLGPVVRTGSSGRRGPGGCGHGACRARGRPLVDRDPRARAQQRRSRHRVPTLRRRRSEPVDERHLPPLSLTHRRRRFLRFFFLAAIEARQGRARAAGSRSSRAAAAGSSCSRRPAGTG